MYNDETPNSAYTAFLQSKKADEDSRRKDQYRNSVTNVAKAVIEQNGLLQSQLQELQEQNRMLHEQMIQAQSDAMESKTEARKNKIFCWVSFGVGTLIGIIGIILGIVI